MAQKPKNDRKVTLADIAEDTGVSKATVSLVLRDKPGVSDEIRQKVLDSATALGYIYTPWTREQSRSIPDQIGLLIKSRPDDLPQANGFYSPVIAGIETVCRRHQINLLYANLLVDEHNNPLEIPRLLADQKASGFLIVGMHLTPSVTDEFLDFDSPMVLVDAYSDEDQFDSVITDNLVGAYRATSYLMQKGHEHIGMVGSEPAAYPSILDRRAGYLRAMEDSGLTPYLADTPLQGTSVEPAIADFLSSHPQVTAVFSVNDDIAITTMRVAKQVGRRLPEDLSIIGFDNIELSQHITPRLTTMRVDKMGMGRQAAQLLLNRIEFPMAGRLRTIVCPHLIERDSVIPA